MQHAGKMWGVGGYLSPLALLSLILNSKMWPQVPWHLGEILLTADVPNKVARDILINAFAPHLEQAPELKHALWLGCNKKMLTAGPSADA